MARPDVWVRSVNINRKHKEWWVRWFLLRINTTLLCFLCLLSIRSSAPKETEMPSAPPPTPPRLRRTRLSERIPPPPPPPLPPPRRHLPHDLRLYCYHLTSRSQPWPLTLHLTDSPPLLFVPKICKLPDGWRWRTRGGTSFPRRSRRCWSPLFCLADEEKENVLLMSKPEKFYKTFALLHLHLLPPHKLPPFVSESPG